jgi:hypothetical protein
MEAAVEAVDLKDCKLLKDMREKRVKAMSDAIIAAVPVRFREERRASPLWNDESVFYWRVNVHNLLEQNRIVRSFFLAVRVTEKDGEAKAKVEELKTT